LENNKDDKAVPGFVFVPAEEGAGIEENASLLSARPTALIIDDEVMTGEVTAEMMRHLGFETEYFDRPLTALPTLRARSFNIIMIDYLMPKINGLDFIREHGSLFGDARVILMTGLSSFDVSDVEKTCKVSVLMKPFALKELTSLVQGMKTKSRQQTNG